MPADKGFEKPLKQRYICASVGADDKVGDGEVVAKEM